MAITSPGIGSGLDVNSIVTQLMTLEQRPLTLLNQREAAFQAKLSGLGTIQGALAALQTASQTLSGAGTAQYRASSSDANILAAGSDATATAGNYSISVTKVAQAQKLIAAGQTGTANAIGAGATTTLDFSFGTISGGALDSASGTYSGAGFAANTAGVPFSVTIDSSNNTLTGIRDAINAAHGGVTASIINDGSGTPYRLALSVAGTGVANSLKIGVTGEAAIGSLLAYDPAGTQNLAQTQVAQNAALTVDGVAITSASNTIAEAIQGVTLTLSNVTAGTPVNLTVARDTSGLVSAMSSFINAYNSLNTALAGVTGKNAVLQGDSRALTVQRQVRSLIGGVQVPGGVLSVLSQVGVSFQKDGSLKLDVGVLNAKIASDPTAVSALVTAAGKKLDDVATSLLGTSGPLKSGSDGITRSIHDISTQRSRIQQRLTSTEARLRAQYSALDTMMSGMSQTSNFLQQQFANLNKG